MLTLQVLDRIAIQEAAALVAREQAAARSHRSRMPAAYTDPEHCRVTLEELLADGYIGFVAHDGRGCAGVMCGRTTDSVGFVPAHGLAVDPDLVDSTAVIVGLFAELAPVLLRDRALRFTIDHVDLDPLGAALHNAGFGRGGVFATQPARPTAAAVDVDIRVGTSADLDSIAALSQIEFAHRSTPPIYAPPLPRTLTQARALHERLLDDGAVHFLARRDNRDVGLLTVEFTSPAPRLCPNAQPYIGATASHPSVRGQGIGRALVQAVLDWAYVGGHETVSVDFDSSNPLSRPFWLGMGFEPTGYRVRRTIDASYAVLSQTGD
jgi:GNAT superfamily N-acetyltransferase